MFLNVGPPPIAGRFDASNLVQGGEHLLWMRALTQGGEGHLILQKFGECHHQRQVDLSRYAAEGKKTCVHVSISREVALTQEHPSRPRKYTMLLSPDSNNTSSLKIFELTPRRSTSGMSTSYLRQLGQSLALARVPPPAVAAQIAVVISSNGRRQAWSSQTC